MSGFAWAMISGDAIRCILSDSIAVWPPAHSTILPEPPPSDDPAAHEPDVQAPREAGTRDSEFGTIAVKFQPADAEVLIDGELWQGADQDRRLLVSLPAGPHRVEVRKPGHKSFSTDVDVTPGETTSVNVSLSKDGRP